MATRQNHPRLVVQHPAGVVFFLVLVVLWFVGRLVEEQSWERLRLLSRLSGYAAALCMLIPYLHILRRFLLHRSLGSSHRWLSCHIAGAYLGFFFLLLHCRARTEGGLTLALLVLVWAVMFSGVVGFYGQKLLYRLLPRLVAYEYGLERLEPEKRHCLEKAYCILGENQVVGLKTILEQKTANDKALVAALVAVVGSEERLKQSTRKTSPQKSRALLGLALHRVLAQKGLLNSSAPASVRELRRANRKLVLACFPGLLRDVPQAVAEFCDEAIDKCLARPFTFWRWVRTSKESNRLYENRYKRALLIASEKVDQELVEALWRLVEKRRLLDYEYRLHTLGRLWLLVHGPLALALLVLLVEHIAMSMRFGGF